jgi:transcriptional regulator
MPPRIPPPRAATIREALRAALAAGPATARDLSQQVGVRERDVADHLEHLARSLATRGEHLTVEPATCLACGFTFHRRERLTRPSACPRCRGTRIDPPVFHIEHDG